MIKHITNHLQKRLLSTNPNQLKLKLLLFNLILFITISFGQNVQKKIFKLKMNLKENTEIKKISESLKTGMIEYIEPGETEYTATDVEKCIELINNFLDKISESNSKKNGMILVKNIVLSLNDLNENCEHELIETDQREQLAEIIILAGYLKRYNGRYEDITEDWREW